MKKETKYTNVIKQYKKVSFDDITKETVKEHNLYWQQIRDHPYRISTTGGSGSGKTNSLFNLISH